MRECKLMSGDSHIIEPPDLWTSRVPDRFKSRAPRLESFEKGDAWVFEGALGPINFGSNVSGGLGPQGRSAWIRWKDIRPICHDPNERLKALDQDGCDAELLYATPRISGAICFTAEVDRDLHIALVQAYNDYMSDFCSHAPDHLFGLAMMPNVGVDEAVGEFRRVMKLPGIRGVVCGRYPSGGPSASPSEDPFWAELQEAGVPLSVHVSLGRGGGEAPGSHANVAGGEFRFLAAPTLAADFVYSGVFDRFPRLALVLAEVDCGWIPYVKEQMNDRHKRYPPEDRPKLALLPSEYFERNIFFTYITDSYGVKNWDLVGADQMMWSSDFAHSGTNWPNSWEVIERDFADVPLEVKHKVLAGNLMRVYNAP